MVAVDVLHDASHVVQTSRRLKLLLKAGGRLLIGEATERNSVFQLASVGFIEGLANTAISAAGMRNRCAPLRMAGGSRSGRVCKRAGVARQIVATAPASAGGAFA